MWKYSFADQKDVDHQIEVTGKTKYDKYLKIAQFKDEYFFTSEMNAFTSLFSGLTAISTNKEAASPASLPITLHSRKCDSKKTAFLYLLTN